MKLGIIGNIGVKRFTWNWNIKWNWFLVGSLHSGSYLPNPLHLSNKK